MEDSPITPISSRRNRGLIVDCNTFIRPWLDECKGEVLSPQGLALAWSR